VPGRDWRGKRASDMGAEKRGKREGSGGKPSTALDGWPVVEVGEVEERRARQLHSASVVVDTCNTAAMWGEDYVRDRLVPSGVDVIVKSVPDIGDHHDTALQLAKVFAWIRKFGDHLSKAVSYSDIEKARSQGKIAVILGFQGSQPLNGLLDLLDVYYEMGIRVMQPTYNSRGYAGDGCLERIDGGLSNWGLKLVEKMNGLGMLIDLSHASSKTSKDILEVSEKAVLCSHSNCKALVNSPRNVEDELIQGIARRDGVIGITTFLPMVSEAWDRTPSIDEVMDHVDYVVSLVGCGHVGFGLDLPEGLTRSVYDTFDFAHSYPSWEQHSKHLIKEIESVVQARNLTRCLVKRGYSDDDIQAILGGNFLRLFRDVVG
jgi:membrane dipeptidase